MPRGDKAMLARYARDDAMSVEQRCLRDDSAQAAMRASARAAGDASGDAQDICCKDIARGCASARVAAVAAFLRRFAASCAFKITRRRCFIRAAMRIDILQA